MKNGNAEVTDQTLEETSEQTGNDFNKTKKDDLFKVDPRNIAMEEGLNIRNIHPNSPEMVHLKASILQNGVRQALTLTANPKFGVDGDTREYLCVDGHRRLTAVFQLMDEGHKIEYVSSKVKKRMTEEEIVLSMFLLNDGEPLNPIEKAEGVHRLIMVFGLSPKQVAEKIGETEATISNLRQMAEMPTKVKNKIADNTISSSLALELARKTKGDVDFVEIVEQLVAEVEQKGAKGMTKQGKKSSRATITAKDAKKFLGEKNLPKLLQEVAVQLEKDEQTGEVVDFFWKLTRLLDKAPTKEKIMELFATK